jgi:polyisoprenoid-binding protein YceI
MNTHLERAPGERPPASRLDQNARERWEVDETRSRLAFTLRHLILQEIHGEFEQCGGTLFLDRRQPSLSSVQLWVDLATLDTDSTERDDHARSEEFLDVAHFPRATFESTTVEIRESDVVVNGRLDLHGVVRDIEVFIQPSTMPDDARPGRRQTFSARAKINRQSFGLHWNQDLDAGGFVLGDEIEIVAHIEILRAVDDV